jgi:Fe-coproporphyrin III synthase
VIIKNFWPAYFIDYYVQCRVFGRRSPILAGFKITHECNLRCRHCPFWSKATNIPLTFETIVTIFRTLQDKGVRILIIEGGEPFLWKDHTKTIHDVVREAKKYFFSVGLVTNGTFPLDIPTDVLWVSIDGLKDAHTQIRGAAFERIVQHIEQSPHPHVLANITINTINNQHIADIVKYFASRVKGFTIQFHYPYDSDTSLCLSPQQKDTVISCLLSLKHDGYSILDSVRCLEAMRHNNWKCEDWMIANVEPDGQINTGCYVKNRGDVNCTMCGFAAHTEISQAFQLQLGPIRAGMKIFKYRNLQAV